jgi:hypothetical protein
VPDGDLLARVYETLEGYYDLGCEVRDEPFARFVRNLDAPRIYDVNYAAFVRADTKAEIASVLARADDLFDGLPHRVFHIDPWTPPAFEAQLMLDGFEFEDELQLLLEGSLSHAGDLPEIDIRLVESDEDWSTVRRLARLDHEEQARRQVHPLWDEEVTSEMVATKRVKAPALRFWLARPRRLRVPVVVAGRERRRQGGGPVHAPRLPPPGRCQRIDRPLRPRRA